MKDLITAIFKRELERLNNESKKESLDMEAIRKLELLVRSHRQFEAPAIEDDNKLGDIPTEDLFAFLQQEDEVIDDGSEAESCPPRVSRCEPPSPPKGKKGTVGKGRNKGVSPRSKSARNAKGV